MKSQFEAILTRIPMYLLVNGGLALLIVSALGYALLGLTPFTALELVVSTFVFCTFAVTSSYLLGKAYRLHSHLQSALITGLILALIYTPTLDAIMLLQYALITVIAMASKFVIAPRGRHIFNPAAFGAFVGGLMQLEFASWWIGAPTFVAIVSIVSFAVLYKTRQLLLGTIFGITSVGAITISGMMSGGIAQELVKTALLSWPLIFMAGIMLSEPLTLPPRRWQRIALAFLVGIVTALPFHIAWFNSSPVFALLVGNLFALIVAWRERYGLVLTLKDRRPLTASAEEYVFSASRPIYFTPGQYVELTLPHPRQDTRGIRRSFSITSTPGESELRLGIKFYDPSSTFKQALRQLPIGSTVQTTGVAGDFTLPHNSSAKLLFIAGGIGITPFISHIRSLTGQGRDITVLYYNRNPSDIPYRDLLDTSGVTIHYLESPTLTLEYFADLVPGLSQHHTYISGPPAMVASIKSTLLGHTAAIHTDYFSGY